MMFGKKNAVVTGEDEKGVIELLDIFKRFENLADTSSIAVRQLS